MKQCNIKYNTNYNGGDKNKKSQYSNIQPIPTKILTRSDKSANWRQTNEVYLVNTKDFSVTKSIINDRPVFNIIWKSNPIPAHVYKSIASNFRRNDNYAPINDEQRKEIADLVTDINKYNAAHSTVEQVTAIRSIIVKEKIIKNYSRMNRDISAMLTEYNKGKCILELSVKYDFAPLNLLRGLLIANGLPEKQLYSVFALKTDPSKILSGRDLQQYLLATANDAESTFNQQENARIAQENENRVVEYFKSLGIRIKNQDELVAEQIKKHGRATLTPDILFLDTVYINGIRCHWIDYKDYICTRVEFLYSSNCAQAEKYYNAYGTGALVFHHSYVNGVKIPHTQILDCRAIPVGLI